MSSRNAFLGLDFKSWESETQKEEAQGLQPHCAPGSLGPGLGVGQGRFITWGCTWARGAWTMFHADAQGLSGFPGLGRTRSRGRLLRREPRVAEEARRVGESP